MVESRIVADAREAASEHITEEMLEQLSQIVCLDIESTGLDKNAEITEIAWGGLLVGNRVQVLRLPHTRLGATEEGLRVSRYWERQLDDQTQWCSTEDIVSFHSSLQGVTLLGSNPRFDATHLTRLFERLGLSPEPWKHRLQDISSYGSGVFGWILPQGLAKVTDHLRELGYAVPEPDHTAVRDVECTIAGFLALLEIAQSRGRA